MTTQSVRFRTTQVLERLAKPLAGFRVLRIRLDDQAPVERGGVPGDLLGVLQLQGTLPMPAWPWTLDFRL